MRYIPEILTCTYLIVCTIGYALKKRRETEDIVSGNIDITL